MSTTRTVVACVVGLGAVAAVAAVSDACGGTLSVGYDDGGNFHAADGAVLTYGGACVGWDASHYLPDADNVCALHGDSCNAWFQPSGWLLSFGCHPTAILDDAGQPIFPDSGGPALLSSDAGACGIVSGAANVTCDPHDPHAGDFCTAYWEQFVTHGHVSGYCAGNTCGYHEVVSCVPQEGIALTDSDGAVQCAPPCSP